MALTEVPGKLDDELPGYVEFNGELDNPKQGDFMASVERAAGAGTSKAPVRPLPTPFLVLIKTTH